MSGPENTANRDPFVHLAGSMGGTGVSGYIEDMESAGQRQVVNSDRLPTQTHGTDEAFLDLGFSLGDPDPADPMFRPATLPEGWKREGGDHAMWSYIVDERGIRRVAIFYKAAFYDRRADMHLQDVGGALATEAIYGDGAVTGPWDKLTEDERASVRHSAEEYLAQAEEHPSIYGGRASRAHDVLRQIAGSA